jgi:tetratricopeptide (TPR) repeat protein
VSLRLGDAAAAGESYRKGLEIAEALVRADPASDLAHRDLSVSANKLASACLELGETTAAREHFTQCLKLRQALADAHPESAEAQTDLVTALANLAAAQGEACLYSESAESLRRASAVLERLFAEGKLKDQPEWAAKRRDLKSALTLAEASVRARDNGDFAESPSTSAPPELLAARAVALVEQAQYAKAGTIADRIRTLQPKDPAHLFWAARVLARIVAVAPPDEGDFRGRCAFGAIQFLEEARALDAYKTQTDRDRLARADDFASLRKEPGFVQLLKKVNAESAAPAASTTPR